MRGFDRPLKPVWIYDFLNIVNIGDRISDHNEEFNKIVWELEGTTGKRKVRTVLSRFFLKTEDNSKSQVVENNPIINLCRKYSLETIKPVLLYYLFIRSFMLRSIMGTIYDLYGTGEINYDFLRKKTVEKHGNREIATRTLRNLLSTLEAFDILLKSKKKYKLKKRLVVNEPMACHMLKFYCEEYKKTPVLELNDIEPYLFIYFSMPDWTEIARKNNGKLWEYSIRFNKRYIIFNGHYKWDDQ